MGNSSPLDTQADDLRSLRQAYQAHKKSYSIQIKSWVGTGTGADAEWRDPVASGSWPGPRASRRPVFDSEAPPPPAPPAKMHRQACGQKAVIDWVRSMGTGSTRLLADTTANELEPEGTATTSQSSWSIAERHRGSDAHADAQVQYTTVAIRNLPLGTTQSEFLQELDGSGFAGEYDYAYLPRHFDTGLGKGHAFVNFMTHSTALMFRSSWDLTKRFDMEPEATPLSVVPAVVQGFQANTKSWTPGKLTRVKNRDHVPFMRGVTRLALASPSSSPALLLNGALGGGQRAAVGPEQCLASS